MGDGYNSLLLEYKNESNGTPFAGSEGVTGRYSEEEIRFNLLAIAQRPLPILTSQLTELSSWQSTLISHLSQLIPDWDALSECVPATDSKVDGPLLTKTVKGGDARELLALKKALDRDLALCRERVVNEEEKLSEYTGFVMRRRNDYAPFIKCMLEKLAENDLIRPFYS
jgi:hypothetical protein